ncbi:hypothetical protein SAMD00019534_098610 [Acytostelium subglobosum LB1]|uniref:hypothetical protein n=1 Tax=Acytostelium subglobosum LB1 TaxID=1410327 RepID=UPI000645070C|nr:hypothetical protein SAMD00019534_098610 [Acytostelium subglobosum LB1]GAM26686.1 hypothetical protein SAMD00019534_098610 [Acytostelium subglobosum LB1]|eukprot:XP_012750347.1 hypothetical protein SAMD00019534_098610 [Acytostelium subglobosum LB1]
MKSLTKFIRSSSEKTIRKQSSANSLAGAPFSKSHNTINLSVADGASSRDVPLSCCFAAPSPSCTLSQKNYINLLPYDILLTITSMVHQNTILTPQFINIALVCQLWHKLARLNGNNIVLDRLFRRMDASKMKNSTIESTINYITYRYPSLDSVVLSRLSLGATHFKHTMFFVDHMERIFSVKVDLNKCDSKEFAQLCTVLKTKRPLKTISMDNLTSQHQFYLLDLLEHSTSVSSVTLNNINLVAQEDATSLHNYLVEAKTLTELNMSFTGSQPVETVKQMLAANSSLRHIRLTCLPTNATQMRPLSKFVYPFQTLSTLVLSNCDLNNIEIEQLAHILTTNRSIKHLDLSHNRFVQPKAIATLLAAITENEQLPLVELNLSGLACNDAVLKQLGQFISKSKRLQRLDVSDCPLQWTESFAEFAQSLGESRTLTSLKLNGNKINANHFHDLINILCSKDTSIASLELYGTLNPTIGNQYRDRLKKNDNGTLFMDLLNSRIYRTV